jgi:hypothetical protein
MAQHWVYLLPTAPSSGHMQPGPNHGQMITPAAKKASQGVLCTILREPPESKGSRRCCAPGAEAAVVSVTPQASERENNKQDQ